MFGLFKKQISPHDFGQVVMHYTTDFRIADCSRSLGCAFDDFDGSVRSDHFLEARGLAIPFQKKYFQYFSHAAIQMACACFDPQDRLAVVVGGMSLFKAPEPGYDVEKTYSILEAACRRERPYPSWIADASAPNCTSLASEFAKCIMGLWPCPEGDLRTVYVERFPNVCSPLEAAAATIRRAGEQVRSEYKPTFEVRF